MLAGWEPSAFTLLAEDLGSCFGQKQSLSAGQKNTPTSPVWLDAIAADAPEMVSKQEKEHLLVAIADSLFSFDPAIKQCILEYHDRGKKSLLVNSEVQAIVREHTRYGLRIRLAYEGLEGFPIYATLGYSGGFGELAFGLPAEVIQSLVDQARRALEAKTIAPAVMPVVFAGGSAGLWLHETVGHLFEADVFPDTLAIGENIGPASLNIYDDATADDRQGSYVADDQGVEGQRTMLIEYGQIAGLLTDRYHAQVQKMPLSGNGRRASYDVPPLPRMTNLFMEPGLLGKDEIIQSVQNGLYVEQARAGKHNPITGEFQLMVTEGFTIKAGRLDHPVRELAISGKGLAALRNIQAIGNDLKKDRGMGLCEKAGQVVSVSVNTPTVLVGELNVRPVD